VVLDNYLVLFWKIFFFPLYMFFWYFFMNTIFDNRKSKIDSWLLITILNIVYVKSTTNLRPSWRAVTKTFHAYSYHVQAEICLFYEALSNLFTSLPQELGNFLSMVTWFDSWDDKQGDFIFQAVRPLFIGSHMKFFSEPNFNNSEF
jgi:hypothetical protein